MYGLGAGERIVMVIVVTELRALRWIRTVHAPIRQDPIILRLLLVNVTHL